LLRYLLIAHIRQQKNVADIVLDRCESFLALFGIGSPVNLMQCIEQVADYSALLQALVPGHADDAV
jgi:hypothetical protein